MLLKRLELQGFGNFKHTVVDFDNIEGKVIAVCGGNGAGKTHFLEASCPGLLYRKLPYYEESFLDHVPESGMIAATYQVGEREIQLALKGKKKGGKVEGYVSVDAQPTHGPKVTEYDKFIEENFPTQEVMLVSAYATQGGRGSFFSMKRADRYRLFAEMLGIDSLEHYAKLAASFCKDRSVEAGTAEEFLHRLNVNAERRVELEAELKDLRSALSHWTSILELARVDLPKAIAVHEEARDAHLKLAVRSQQAHDAVVAKSDELASLKAALKAVGIELETLSADQVEFDAEVIQAEIAKVDAEVGHKQGVINEYTKQVDEDLECLREHQTKVDDLEVEISQLHAVRTQEEHAADSSRQMLSPIIKTLDQVDTSNPMCATCPLTREALEAMGKRESVDLDEKMRQEAYTGACDRKAADLIALHEDKGIQNKALRVHELRKSIDSERALIESLENEKVTLNNRLVAAADAANRQGQIKSLQSRAGQLVEDIATVDTALRVATEEEAAVAGEKDTLEEASKALDEVRAKELQATQEIGSVESKVGRVEQELAGLEHDENRAKELQTDLDALAQTVEDHRILESSLRQLRVLEIDSIAPEVSEVANELLQDFEDGRFALQLDTLVEKKGGGEKEDFVPKVVDTLTGRVGVKCSGGEQAIIDEALRLAISVVNARRSEFAMRTLWRDETTSSLSEKNASIYVPMLRKAAELGGFERVLFVAHHSEARNQADARIWLDNTKVPSVTFD